MVQKPRCDGEIDQLGDSTLTDQSGCRESPVELRENVFGASQLGTHVPRL